MDNDWVYPEKPYPAAATDEWLAWYEDHVDCIEKDVVLLREALIECREFVSPPELVEEAELHDMIEKVLEQTEEKRA